MCYYIASFQNIYTRLLCFRLYHWPLEAAAESPLHKMPRHNKTVSEEDRRRIVQCFENGEDFVALAATLNVKRTTAYSIVRRFQATGHVARAPPSGGRQPKLDQESIDFLCLLVDANPCITLKELNATLRDIFPRKPQVTTMSVSRALQGQLITLKQAHNISGTRNSPQVKVARIAYAHWMYEVGLHKHRIYVDETGFNLYTKRTYGRAVQGQRVNRVVKGQRGNNVTVIVAISDMVGVVYHEIHDRSVTREAFASFMTCLEVMLGEEETVIIMDNAPCHQGIQDNFENLEIKFLPAYSPFLNPIEECFSVFKAHLKHRLNDISAGNLDDARAARQAGMFLYQRRQQQLHTAINDTLEPSVTREVVTANYHHSNGYLMACLQEQDIWH